MSRGDINVDDKKMNRRKFYKNKKLFQIDDIDVCKIQVSIKKKHMAKRMHLNILLDIMIMMLQDHYE